MTPFKGRLAAGSLFLTLAAGLAVHAQDTQQLAGELLSSSETILGQEIAYPDGKPVMTAVVVVLKPGEQTPVHRHDAPMFALILEGEVTVDYGDAGSRVYRANDTFIEALGTEHFGKNTGRVDVRILTVFAGSDAVANTTIAP